MCTLVKKVGLDMRGRRCRNLLLFAIGALAVLFPTAIAAAACPLHPLPPCAHPGFTGRAGTSARCGHKPPPVCHVHRSRAVYFRFLIDLLGPEDRAAAIATFVRDD